MQEDNENKELDQLLTYVRDAVTPLPPRDSSIKREVFEWVKMVVWVVVMFYGLRTFVVEGFEIRGHSMENTLENHERVLVAKFIYMFRPIQRGDVIVFRSPQDPKRRFVKRVIGLPGDRIAIKGGIVHVNGQPVDEPYVYENDRGLRSREKLLTAVVPERSYYVLGDHRNVSSDSRNWKSVPRDAIIGKVMFRFWPPSEVGVL